MMHVAPTLVVATTHQPVMRPTQPTLCPRHQHDAHRCALPQAQLAHGSRPAGSASQSTSGAALHSAASDSQQPRLLHPQPLPNHYQRHQQEGTPPAAVVQPSKCAPAQPKAHRTHRKGWGPKPSTVSSSISKEAAELIQDLVAQVFGASRGQQGSVPGEALEEAVSRIEAVLTASGSLSQSTPGSAPPPPLPPSPAAGPPRPGVAPSPFSSASTSIPQRAPGSDIGRPVAGHVATPQQWAQLLRALKAADVQVGPRLLGVLLEDVPPASLMQLSGTPAQAAALLTAVVTIRTDVDNNNPSYRTVPSRSGSSRHGGSQGGAGDVNATPSTSSVDGVSGRGTSATTTVPLSSEVQPDEESSTTFILYPPPKPSNAEETGVIAVSGLELALEPETGGASHQPSPQHSASTTPPGVSTLRTHQPPPQHSITTQVTGGSGSQAHTGGQHRHATSQRLSAWVQSSLVTLAPVAGTSALPVASLLALLRSLIRTRTRVPDAFMRSLYASTAQLSPQGSAAQHTGPGVGSGSAEALDSATDSTEPAQSNGGDAAGGRQQVALGMLSPSQLQQLLWAVSQLVTAGPGALPPPLEWLKAVEEVTLQLALGRSQQHDGADGSATHSLEQQQQGHQGEQQQQQEEEGQNGGQEDRAGPSEAHAGRRSSGGWWREAPGTQQQHHLSAASTCASILVSLAHLSSAVSSSSSDQSTSGSASGASTIASSGTSSITSNSSTTKSSTSSSTKSSTKSSTTSSTSNSSSSTPTPLELPDLEDPTPDSAVRSTAQLSSPFVSTDLLRAVEVATRSALEAGALPVSLCLETLWAFARLGWVPEDTWHAAAARCVQQQQAAGATGIQAAVPAAYVRGPQAAAAGGRAAAVGVAPPPVQTVTAASGSTGRQGRGAQGPPVGTRPVKHSSSSHSRGLGSWSPEKMVQGLWAVAHMRQLQQAGRQQQQQPQQRQQEAGLGPLRTDAGHQQQQQPQQSQQSQQVQQQQAGTGVERSGAAEHHLDGDQSCGQGFAALWTHALLPALQPHLPGLSGATLVTLVWSLAVLQPAIEGVTEGRTAATDGSAISGTSRVVGTADSTMPGSTIPKALQQYDLSHSFLTQVITAVTPKLSSTSSHLAVVLLWSLSLLGLRVQPQQLGLPGTLPAAMTGTAGTGGAVSSSVSPQQPPDSFSATELPTSVTAHIPDGTPDDQQQQSNMTIALQSCASTAAAADQQRSYATTALQSCVSAAAAARALSGLSSLSARDVSALSTSLAHLQWTPEPRQLEKLLSHAGRPRVLHLLQLEHLGQLVLGCSTLAVRCSQQYPLGYPVPTRLPSTAHTSTTGLQGSLPPGTSQLLPASANSTGQADTIRAAASKLVFALTDAAPAALQQASQFTLQREPAGGWPSSKAVAGLADLLHGFAALLAWLTTNITAVPASGASYMPVPSRPVLVGQQQQQQQQRQQQRQQQQHQQVKTVPALSTQQQQSLHKLVDACEVTLASWLHATSHSASHSSHSHCHSLPESLKGSDISATALLRCLGGWLACKQLLAAIRSPPQACNRPTATPTSSHTNAAAVSWSTGGTNTTRHARNDSNSPGSMAWPHLLQPTPPASLSNMLQHSSSSSSSSSSSIGPQLLRPPTRTASTTNQQGSGSTVNDGAPHTSTSAVQQSSDAHLRHAAGLHGSPRPAHAHPSALAQATAAGPVDPSTTGVTTVQVVAVDPRMRTALAAAAPVLLLSVPPTQAPAALSVLLHCHAAAAQQPSCDLLAAALEVLTARKGSCRVVGMGAGTAAELTAAIVQLQAQGVKEQQAEQQGSRLFQEVQQPLSPKHQPLLSKQQQQRQQQQQQDQDQDMSSLLGKLLVAVSAAAPASPAQVLQGSNSGHLLQAGAPLLSSFFPTLPGLGYTPGQPNQTQPGKLDPPASGAPAPAAIPAAPSPPVRNPKQPLLSAPTAGNDSSLLASIVRALPSATDLSTVTGILSSIASAPPAPASPVHLHQQPPVALVGSATTRTNTFDPSMSATAATTTTINNNSSSSSAVSLHRHRQEMQALQAAVWQASAPLLSVSSHSQLARLLQAIAKLAWQPPVKWNQRLMTALARHADQASTQSLKSHAIPAAGLTGEAAGATTQAGPSRKAGLTQQAALSGNDSSHTSALAWGLDLHETVAALWGVTTLGLTPPPAWLQACHTALPGLLSGSATTARSGSSDQATQGATDQGPRQLHSPSVTLLWCIARNPQLLVPSSPSASQPEGGTRQVQVPSQATSTEAEDTTAKQQQQQQLTGVERDTKICSLPAWVPLAAQHISSGLQQLSLDPLCSALWSCSALLQHTPAMDLTSNQKVQSARRGKAAPRTGKAAGSRHIAVSNVATGSLQELHTQAQSALQRRLHALAVAAKGDSAAALALAEGAGLSVPGLLSATQALASGSSSSTSASASVTIPRGCPTGFQQEQVQVQIGAGGSTIPQPVSAVLALLLPVCTSKEALSVLRVLCAHNVRMGPILRTSLFSRMEHELSLFSHSHLSSHSASSGSSGSGKEASGKGGGAGPGVGTRQAASQLRGGDVALVATTLARLAQGKSGAAQSPGNGDQQDLSTSAQDSRTPIPPRLRSALCAAVLRCLPYMSCTQAVAAVHALAVLGATVDGRPAERLLKHMARMLKEGSLPPHALVTLVWSIARLSAERRWRPAAPLLAATCARIADVARSLSLGHVSRVVWALARMDYRPPPALMRLMLARARATLVSAGAGEVSTLLYSLGALGFRPPAGWLSFLFRVTFPWLLLGSGSSVGTRTSNRQLLLNDQAQSSSNSSILGRGTLHRYKQRFSGRDVARMLWALATLQYMPPPAWLALAMRRARTSLPSCTSHDLTLLAVGVAILGPPVTLTWLRSFRAAVKAQPLRGGLQSQVNLVWAWRRLRERVELDKQATEGRMPTRHALSLPRPAVRRPPAKTGAAAVRRRGVRVKGRLAPRRRLIKTGFNGKQAGSQAE